MAVKRAGLAEREARRRVEREEREHRLAAERTRIVAERSEAKARRIAAANERRRQAEESKAEAERNRRLARESLRSWSRAALVEDDRTAEYDGEVQPPAPELQEIEPSEPPRQSNPWNGPSNPHTNRETRRGRTGLTLDDVLVIARLRAEGEQIKTIAERFGVSRNAVWNIVSGRTWNGYGKAEGREGDSPFPALTPTAGTHARERTRTPDDGRTVIELTDGAQAAQSSADSVT